MVDKLEAVEVTQADRDAAASLYSLHTARPEADRALAFTSGAMDDHDFVQAFARHRRHEADVSACTAVMLGRPIDPDASTVELVRYWMMSSDHPVNAWERDFAAAIEAHSRTTPADGEQVERVMIRARVHQALAAIEDDTRLTDLTDAEIDTIIAAATPTEDARERVKVLQEALGDIISHFGNREQGPGHSHAVKGIWDKDVGNGEKGGTVCDWCAKWERARTALGNKETDRHG